MTYLRTLCTIAAIGIAACTYVHQPPADKQQHPTRRSPISAISRWIPFYPSPTVAKCKAKPKPKSEPEPVPVPKHPFTTHSLIAGYPGDDQAEGAGGGDDEEDAEGATEQFRISGGEDGPVFWVIPVFLLQSFAAKPTRSLFLLGDDCRVYFDSRTKTACWTVEKINADRVRCVQHRHCEEFKFNCVLGEGIRFGNPGNNVRLDVRSVEIPLQTRHATIGPAGNAIYVKQNICEFCLKRTYWTVFNAYLTFLCQFYDEVEVCSGVVCKPKQSTGNVSNGFTLAEVDRSHYFKAINAKNPDGTYRLECYKFDASSEVDARQSLMEHSVSREELEADVGFTIFEKIPPNMVNDSHTKTHKDFTHPPLNPVIEEDKKQEDKKQEDKKQEDKKQEDKKQEGKKQKVKK